jgi:hypothetical protein
MGGPYAVPKPVEIGYTQPVLADVLKQPDALVLGYLVVGVLRCIVGSIGWLSVLATSGAVPAAVRY